VDSDEYKIGAGAAALCWPHHGWHVKLHHTKGKTSNAIMQ